MNHYFAHSRSLIVVWVCCCFSIQLLAQNEFKTDSLQGVFYFQKAGELFENIDSCIYYTKLAMPLLKKTKQWDNYVNCYNSLFYCYRHLGDYTRAERVALEAYDIAKKKLSLSKDMAYNSALNNVGVFYFDKEVDYNKTLTFFKKALESLDPENSNAVKAIRTQLFVNIGTIQERKGEYREAIRYFDKALAERKTSKVQKRFDLIDSYNSLSSVFIKLNKYQDALEANEKIIALIRKDTKNKKYYDHNLVAAYCNNADIYIRVKAFSKARKYIQQAIDVDAEKGKYRAWEFLAELQILEKKYPSAYESLERAHALVQAEFKDGGANGKLAVTHFLFAKILLGMEELELALADLQKGLAFLSTDFDYKDNYEQPHITTVLDPVVLFNFFELKATILEKIYEKSKNHEDLKAALVVYEGAISLLKLIRNDQKNEDSKLLFNEKSAHVFSHAVRLCIRLFELTKQDVYKYKAFEIAEKSKGVILLESLNDADAKVFANIPDALLRKEKEIISEIAFYHRKINEEKEKADKANPEKIKLWAEEHFNLKENLLTLQDKFENNFPEYYQLKYQSENLAVADLQKCIPSRASMLVEYFFADSLLYVFAVTQNDFEIHTLKIPKNFRADVETFKNLISNASSFEQNAHESTARLVTLGRTFYDFLLPCLHGKKNEIDHLVVIPDDVLAKLPFEVFLTEIPQKNSLRNLPYLLKNCAITYANSASLYTNSLASKSKKASKLFVGYAPDFSGEGTRLAQRICTNGNLAKIENKLEVETIATLLGGDTYIGDEATKEAFLKNAGEYKILHIPTHACVNDSSSMFNKIYFAKEDYLYTSELYGLQLNAEMAVLSACETGVGEILKGEGVLNLARGFSYAGCPSITMSLWAINDKSTARLMSDYYAFLELGQSKSRALQHAKLSFLDKNDMEFLPPYYWAAFIHLGNDKAIEMRTSSLGWEYIFIFVCSLLIGFYGIFSLFMAKK